MHFYLWEKIFFTVFYFIQFYAHIIDPIHINLFLLISKVYCPGDRRRNFFLSAIMFPINGYYYFAHTYVSLLRRRGDCDNASEWIIYTLKNINKLYNTITTYHIISIYYSAHWLLSAKAYIALYVILNGTNSSQERQEILSY